MQRAIAEMTLIALAGGALGCWVVLYEFSYAAESLAHSIFPGLVLATLAGVPLLLGAGPAIVLAALAIALAGRVPGVGRDVAVAVVVTTMFGAGVLLALSPDSPPGIETLLFGDILGPSDADLLAAAVLAALVGAAVWLLHGRLLATGFDRASARALGLSPAAVEAALLILLAAATVVAVQGLGNLLVVAVFVGPGGGRPPPHRPGRADDRDRDRDRGARRPRRPLSLLLRRAPRPAPRWRWRSSPPTCWRSPPGPPRAAARRHRRGLRSTEMPAIADSAWAEHALATLQTAGLRRGGARTAVVEALARHDCAVTALELDDELRRGARAARPGERLPGARAARAAGPGAAARGLARHRRLRAGRARRAPSPPRDLPSSAGAWSPSRIPASSARSAGSPSGSASRSQTTTWCCAASASAAPASRRRRAPCGSPRRAPTRAPPRSARDAR